MLPEENAANVDRLLEETPWLREAHFIAKDQGFSTGSWISRRTLRAVGSISRWATRRGRDPDPAPLHCSVRQIGGGLSRISLKARPQR